MDNAQLLAALRAREEDLKNMEDLKKRGNPSPMAAAAAGNLRSLHTMWQRGVDLAVRSYDHRTALHLAASEGHMDVLNFLIREVKVPVNQHDRWGNTAMDDAVRANKQTAITFLEEHGARRGHAADAATFDLCGAASRGDVELLRELVRQGGDAGMCNYDQRTPLHLAAAENQLNAARYLLEEGQVDVDAADRWGNTPLDDANRGRYLERATR